MGDVLRKVISESLIAFPDEAHLHVFRFLAAAGASETEKVRVQQAWSTVALGSEAFGRKKAPIDPVLFGEELIRELASGDKELARLEGLISSFKTIIAEQSSASGPPAPLGSLADLKKPSGTLASLQSMTKLGKELTAALNVTYEVPHDGSSSSSSSSSNSSSSRSGTGGKNSSKNQSEVAVGNDRAIMEWRRSCRGGKFVWHGRKAANASPLYCPLGSSELGGVEIMYGDVVYKNLDAGKEPSRPTNVPIVGVKVTTKQPSLLARTWISHHSLHEIASARDQSMQLFPLPYGIHRDAGAGSLTAASAASVLCAFEMPNCRPLTHMLSPALATFMRRYPSVVLTWCAQLGVASANLLRCTSGCLVRPPTLKDCFIKDNGQLLVGNMTFEAALEQDGVKHEAGDRSNNDISKFAVQVLATSLALSRRHETALSPQSLLPEERENEFGNAEEGSGRKDVFTEEDVVPVMEGCEIQLTFTGHACRGVNLEILGGKVVKGSSSMPSAASSVSGTRLHILVHGEPAVASIVASTASSAETCVTIKATRAGLLLIHAVSPSNVLLQEAGGSGGEAGPSHSAGRLAAAVRIVVVPAYPVMATELQEVIGLVDAAFSSKNLKYVLNAQSITSPTASTNDEASVARDWSTISRAVFDVIDPSHSFRESPSSPPKGRRPKNV